MNTAVCLSVYLSLALRPFQLVCPSCDTPDPKQYNPNIPARNLLKKSLGAQCVRFALAETRDATYAKAGGGEGRGRGKGGGVGGGGYFYSLSAMCAAASCVRAPVSVISSSLKCLDCCV